MTKSYHQRPSSLTKSANLGGGRLASTKIVNRQNTQQPSLIRLTKVKNNRQYQTHISANQQSLPLPLTIVIITITIFTFGGLGFGYSLRYGNEWQQLSSSQKSSLSSNNLTPSKN